MIRTLSSSSWWLLQLLVVLPSLVLVLVDKSEAASIDDYFGGAESNNNGDYLSWIRERSINHTSSTFLPVLATSTDETTTATEDGAAIHWSIIRGDDGEDEYLYIAVAARPARGWLAFGISETGGMRGSDVVVWKARSSEPHNRLTDGYILQERELLTDECQHWELLSSFSSSSEGAGEDGGGGFLMFEARRRLDTSDGQDRALFNDADDIVPPTRIIAAWGDTTEPTYHGRKNRVRGAVRLFREVGDETDPEAEFVEAMNVATSADGGGGGSFELRAKDYPVKPRDTEYVDFCWTWEDVIAEMTSPPPSSSNDTSMVTVVGVLPVIDPDAARHVHHFILRGSGSAIDNGRNPGTCDGFDLVLETIYAWGPGEPPLVLPEDVGLPLGPGAFQSFKLEVHYDNPELISGVLDSSGIRMYYSNVPRLHEVAILQIGDPWVMMDGTPVGPGLTEHGFMCPGECSSLAMGGTDGGDAADNGNAITVLREALHRHQSGVHMYNEQIRNGAVIHRATVEFFDFDQQGGPSVQQQPFTVLPGDGFRAVCHYDNKDNNATTFGLSSQEEMCIAFLIYYPRRALFGGQFPWQCGPQFLAQECTATWDSTALNSTDDLERTFGVAPQVCINTAAVIAVDGDVVTNSTKGSNDNNVSETPPSRTADTSTTTTDASSNTANSAPTASASAAVRSIGGLAFAGKCALTVLVLCVVGGGFAF